MANNKGFTLIEVVAVTLIIAALALLVVPSFKNSALTNQMEKAKVGLMELTLAVQLYNEDHTTPISSGILDGHRFNILSEVIDRPQRWGIRPGSATERSLQDSNGVLNCRYIIGGGAFILTQTTCKFNKIDAEGFECYRFYVETINPALVKKERLNSCNDL